MDSCLRNCLLHLLGCLVEFDLQMLETGKEKREVLKKYFNTDYKFVQQISCLVFSLILRIPPCDKFGFDTEVIDNNDTYDQLLYSIVNPV